MEMEKNVNTTKKLGVSFKSDYSKLELHVYGDTIDELIDGLALIKDGKFINQFVDEFKSVTEEQLLRLDELMVTTDDAREIVKYAEKRKDKINTQKYQDKLIELKNIPILIWFTRFAIHPDIEKTEDAVINYGKEDCVMDLLECVEGVNEKRIKEFIFNRKKAYYAYYFIKVLQSKKIILNMNDILEAKKIVIESKDMFIIRCWAEHIGDVTEMEDLTIKYGTACDMYRFADNVKNIDIEKFREAINKTDDKTSIGLFNWRFPKPNLKPKSFFDRFKK